MWPRWTVTPVGGTSQILMVLFSLAPIASARSLPTFLASTSNAATNSTSRRGSRRTARASGRGPGWPGRRPCSTRRPGRATRRSCRRRRWLREPNPWDSLPVSSRAVGRSRPGCRRSGALWLPCRRAAGGAARASAGAAVRCRSARSSQRTSRSTRLQPVPLQLEGVAVEPLPRCGRGPRAALPGAPRAGGGGPRGCASGRRAVGAPEEGEVNAEALVLPGCPGRRRRAVRRSAPCPRR